MTLKLALKFLARALFIALLFPCALLSGFGRIKPVYTFFAQACAVVPGIIGDYIRVAFYFMTLRRCSLDAHISFGTFFAHPEATVAPRVIIGSYCILGRTHIGDRTLIASNVQILSGARQHSRDDRGRLDGLQTFTDTTIGADCWIGASAVIMADVGAGATVAAGSVVYHPVPPGATVVANPARVVSQRARADL